MIDEGLAEKIASSIRPHCQSKKLAAHDLAEFYLAFGPTRFLQIIEMMIFVESAHRDSQLLRAERMKADVDLAEKKLKTLQRAESVLDMQKVGT